MAAVSEHTGTIVSPQTRKFCEVSKGYTQFRDGDVIWAKITPCMENGKAAVAHNLINGIACGSTEFFVLRSTDAAFSSAPTMFCVSEHIGGVPPSPAGAYGRSM